MGIFLDIQNNLKIHGGACVSQPRSSANKVQPNLFCVNKFNALDDLIHCICVVNPFNKKLNNSLQSVPQCNDVSIHFLKKLMSHPSHLSPSFFFRHWIFGV